MNELTEDRLPQKRNGNSTPSTDPLIRRHTTPDMVASAAYGMVLCGTDELEHRYRGRIEKVKFGVPITEAFTHDIPATLLVLLLKVNKEGPLKKDIWRAPGNQAQVRKLSNIMQHGRLVNISNISVYTAASVIKRFLAKLPGGIFGPENEKQLFESAQQNITEENQRELFCRVVSSLPVPSQHLLVLLCGTFRVITDSAETFGTRMTPDAIGISVAPSLFHTCIHDGQRAKLEDVMRFKLASKVISELISGFGFTNLFPRECYEFYARITGRTLRVDEHWRFSFQLPSRTLSQPSIHFEQPPESPSGQPPEFELEQYPTTSKAAAEVSEEFCEDEDIYGESLPDVERYAYQYRRRTQSRSLEDPTKAIGWQEWKEAREHEQKRLSTSMGEVVVHSEEEAEQLRSKDYLESTRSLTYLEWVHERQTRRMKTRSEWFLSPSSLPPKNGGSTWSSDFYSRISQQRFSSSPVHFRLPKKEECALSSSGDEEMCSSSGKGCSRSGCGARCVTSTDTSMKCSPYRPDSCCTTSESMGSDAQMKSQTGTEEETSDDDAFLTESQYSPIKIPRQPFQLLQERQYSTSTTEGSASAQVTPSAVDIGHGKNGRQKFFGSGEQEGGLQALPELAETTTSPQPRRFSAPFVEASPIAETEPSGVEEIKEIAEQQEQQKQSPKGTATTMLPRSLIQTMSSGSSGSGSGASAQTVVGIGTLHSSSGGAAHEAQQQQQQQGSRIFGSGLVRRRSWRIHYTRPKNKSLEYESGNVREEVMPSSHSTPLRCSPPSAGNISTRCHSASDEPATTSIHKAISPGTTTTTKCGVTTTTRGAALIRRRSSGNGGASSAGMAKTKPPVQTRKSTQI